MRVTLAVSMAFVVFIFSWLINALLMTALAVAATLAGVKPGIFLLFNIFLIWILSPGLGAAVAVYATAKKFSNVDPSLILVGFVSVTAVVLIMMFSLSLLVYSVQGEGYLNLLTLFAQGGAVFVGAKIGKNAVG
jgi:hypothetical protein